MYIELFGGKGMLCIEYIYSLEEIYIYMLCIMYKICMCS